MIRVPGGLALVFLVCADAHAATINTTLKVKAKAALAGLSISAAGTASLSNIGSGTISATADLLSLLGPSPSIPFTITLSGAGGTITGRLTASVALFTEGGEGTGSATITGGTGTYAGATGSFPNLSGAGSGNLASGVELEFSGDGQIVTVGGGPTGPPPSITAVLDAAGNTPNLAPGSIFIVKGENLCPSGVTFYSVPRPTVSSDGVKITLTTQSGAPTDALIWYTYNPSGTCQLAAILPSPVTPGDYNVVVTNGAASAPFATTVIATKPALFTQDSSGTGLASVQNYISPGVVDLNSFTTGTGKGTTISPAHPGQNLQAYATGLGGVPGLDNVDLPVFDFTAGATVRAIVGGVALPVQFAGRAGYAGQDQVNFKLPADVQTGCTVPFQISVNGVVSNLTFIAIAPVGASACESPGLTASQLQRLDGGGTLTVASFGLQQIQRGTQFTASGTFLQLSGFQLALGVRGATAPGCQVTRAVRVEGTTQPIGYKMLDAGAVTLNGPPGSGISNRAFRRDSALDPYTLPLAQDGNGTIVAGTYALAGAGGPDVGAFTASLDVGAPLAIELPATVIRGAGLTLNWAGGNATDIVQVSGSSGLLEIASFACFTTADQRTLTVPASILTQLPAGSNGTLQVVSRPNPANGNGTFTAPLEAGGSIDSGLFSALVGTGTTVTYQ